MTDLAAGDNPALSSGVNARVEGSASIASPKLKTFLLLIAVILLNAVGNLSLAWGMRHVKEKVALNPLDYVRVMSNPYVAIGILLLISWLLTRITLLSWADLSFVLPLTGVGYVLAAVFGKIFLAESITYVHWVGTLLIFAGTAMVGSTDQRTFIEGGPEI